MNGKRISLILLFVSGALLASNAQNSIDLTPEIKIQQGQSGTVQSVVFSPDGKYLFVAAGDIYAKTDFTLKLWDVASGKEIKSFNGHKYYVTSVDYSPDGKYLLSGSLDETKVWDVETGRVVQSYKSFSNWVNSVKFSPDGKYILTGSNDKTLKLYEMNSWKAIRTYSGSADQVKSVAFSPNGKYALSGSGQENTLILWDIETGQVIKTFAGHTKRVLSVAFSPDGKYAISGSDDHTMKLWDIEGAKELKTFTGYYLGIFNVGFTRDGRFVMGNNILWDVVSGAKYREVPSQDAFMAFTPDGKSFITYGKHLKMWDIATGKQIQEFVGLSALVQTLAVSKDGKSAVTVSGASLKLWDISLGKQIRTYPFDNYGINSVAISPNNKYILSSAGSSIKLRDMASEKVLKEFKYECLTDKALAFSPDGKFALVVLSNNCLILLEIPGGTEIKRFTGHTNSIRSVAFSPDGKFALTGSWDKTLKLWNIATGKEVRTFTGHTSQVNAVAYSPDGKYALSGSGTEYYDVGQEVKLWDIASGKELKTFTGHSLQVNSVAFSPDGKLALSGCNFGSIKIWDIEGGTIVKTFYGHTSAVNSVSFLPDGKRFISGSKDGTMKVWEIATSKWTAFVANSDGTKWLTFTNDGFWDGSSNCGDLVAMIQGMEVWNIDQFAVRNNRPEIILESLGNNDELLINHYKNQHKKRLKRLGITEEQLVPDYHVPIAKITQNSSEGKQGKLGLHFSDEKSGLKSYNVFINDVPLYGALGKQISGTHFIIEESIELTRGVNKIEASCMNTTGAESFRAFTMANFTGETKSNLYFLAFGMSKYNNPELNLRYADKDALDLEKVIQNMKGKGFENVYTKVLTNYQVTPDAIKASKDFVKNAKPDDTFILFIAGHGMHDKDAEATYYYLTRNADINNLKGTAADFETIEDLLQGIPPRNKLFLMDACESGEIDDETYENLTGFENLSGLGIASRGFKSTSTPTTNNQQQSTKRSYLYQKDRYIYNDLVRRSGAIVFSSSKGGELSYERSDIENGLFTEYIMKALTTTEADKDGNGTVSTDELRQYVSEQVAKASGDLQHPTVDRDNIYQKFGFGVKQ